MTDYERIEKLIRYLEETAPLQPSLATLAEQVGLSPAYLQRMFSEWAGVSPKTFLQCLTVAHAKQKLKDGKSVLATALDVGLSGPSRLHDLCVSLEAATPGEIKSGGAGLKITAGHAATVFGECLIASTPRGVCHLFFVDRRDRQFAEQSIQSDWPLAEISWDDNQIESLASDWFVPPSESLPGRKLKTYVKGTEFQVRVWRALLRIPFGTLVSYGDVANAIDLPKASRAVGSAVGQNQISFLIPCHRVIRETGVLGNYRWGSERKKSMLVWETAPKDVATTT